MIRITPIAAKCLLLSCITVLFACTAHEQVVPEAGASAVQCEDPRPEMCTQHYQPVCATRDSGIRCVTTPCDSTETRTYSNGCMACADPAVYYYSEGACEEHGGAGD
ncbi:MAG: hypothetical protein R3308_03460 [Thiohalobacterales bacterium]|nr:hypothetical protein [Thiohalobacterales bacterium]